MFAIHELAAEATEGGDVSSPTFAAGLDHLKAAAALRALADAIEKDDVIVKRITPSLKISSDNFSRSSLLVEYYERVPSFAARRTAPTGE